MPATFIFSVGKDTNKSIKDKTNPIDVWRYDRLFKHPLLWRQRFSGIKLCRWECFRQDKIPAPGRVFRSILQKALQKEGKKKMIFHSLRKLSIFLLSRCISRITFSATKTGKKSHFRKTILGPSWFTQISCGFCSYAGPHPAGEEGEGPDCCYRWEIMLYLPSMSSGSSMPMPEDKKKEDLG